MTGSPPFYQPSDIVTSTGSSTLALLELLRRAEKEQALFYRAMGAQAEERDPSAAQRYHDLHADEQHHLSRLTARVLELGGQPEDLPALRVSLGDPQPAEEQIRARETAEIERYRSALADAQHDSVTRALLEEILRVEEHHAEELGGKWTLA